MIEHASEDQFQPCRGGQVIPRSICRILDDDRGATAIEYSLLAALVGVALIFALQDLSASLNQIFSPVQEEIEAAIPRCVAVNSNCQKSRN
jgi:pilus assembly protein Flp/PilA